MTGSSWALSLRDSGWVWLLVVAAAGLVAWYVYRRTIPPVPERWRRTLLVLRILAICALLVAVLRPTIEWSGNSRRKPRVAVLVDQSESLAFADPEGSRPEVVRRLLEGPGIDRIRREASVSWQGFAERVTPLDPEKLAFTGHASAIGNALLEQRRWTPAPDKLVLVTDGANTGGPDPVRAAEDIRLPVYVVGVGDPNPQKDVRLVGVTAPAIALAGRPTKVVATVENTGFGPRRATVRLRSGSRTLAEQDIALPPAGRRAEVDLTLSAPAPGVVRAVVSVDSIPGELLARNNLWPFTTHVLKAKRRVLILAGAQSADIGFWMRFFGAKEDMEAVLWCAPHPPELSEAPPAILDSLDNVDLVIWHDLPPAALPPERLNSIASAVREGAGMLVFPGRNELPRSWDGVVPVQTGRGRYVAQATQTVFSPSCAGHPVFAGDADFPYWSAGWSVLPPLLGRVVGLAAARTGMVLLTGEGDPIVVAGTYGKGRVVVFGGLTYWRWDTIPVGLGESAPPDRPFWNAIVRWLSVRQPISRVRVQTDASLYRLGQPARVSVQVYDEGYAPLDGADVLLRLDDGAQSLSASGQGSGRYSADLTGLPSGDHAVRATGSLNGVEIGSSTAEFSVAVVGLEHEQTQQQQSLLQAIARAGNGGYAPAAKADSLLAAIRLEEIPEQRDWAVPIGSSGWVLWIAIGLLAAEWVGRRVLGLL